MCIVASVGAGHLCWCTCDTGFWNSGLFVGTCALDVSSITPPWVPCIPHWHLYHLECIHREDPITKKMALSMTFPEYPQKSLPSKTPITLTLLYTPADLAQQDPWNLQQCQSQVTDLHGTTLLHPHQSHTCTQHPTIALAPTNGKVSHSTHQQFLKVGSSIKHITSKQDKTKTKPRKLRISKRNTIIFW